MKKFFLFLLVLALGAGTISGQTMSVSGAGIGIAYKGGKGNSINTAIYSLDSTLAKLVLPHPTMFDPVMENEDSINLSLIYCGHAEMTKDEVYLINIYTGLYWERTEDGSLRIHGATVDVAVSKTLEKIPFTTKRVGVRAYDYYGSPLAFCVPVFVQKTELIKAGVLKE